MLSLMILWQQCIEYFIYSTPNIIFSRIVKETGVEYQNGNKAALFYMSPQVITLLIKVSINCRRFAESFNVVVKRKTFFSSSFYT